MVLTGFYLGFIIQGRSPEWLKVTSFQGGSRGMPSANFLWNEYALRCNLVHFETILRIVTVCACTDFVASGWFFRYSYLYTVMITIFFFLGGGSWAFWGGSFYPSNTLDRTLANYYCWILLSGMRRPPTFSFSFIFILRLSTGVKEVLIMMLHL